MNKEIKRIEYFIPDGNIRKMISADEAFANFSERGIKPDFSRIENPYRYFQLLEGKRWQGITVHELWEAGVLDGSVPYRVLLGGENPKEILPRHIVDFIKKEMFRGQDKENIEDCYQKVLAYWTWWRRLWFLIKNFLSILQQLSK
jgi:hypothetical protein